MSMSKICIPIAQQDAQLFKELLDSTDLADLVKEIAPKAGTDHPVNFSLDSGIGNAINYYYLGMAWQSVMAEREKAQPKSQPVAGAYPDTLTPELDEVLGWPNFKCGPFAQIFRLSGFTIQPKAEREQAFVLHWLIKLVLKHGADWQKVAQAELQKLHTAAQEKQEGEAAP